MLRKFLTDLKEGFLDILYPPDARCAFCSREVDVLPECHVCQDCVSQLPLIIPPVCISCGKPVSISGSQCPDCIGTMHFFDQAVSVFEFNPILQKLVYRYKYRGEQYLAASFAHWMVDKLEDQMKTWPAIDGFIPVPLHPNRKKNRGFNQAELLCREMSNKTGISTLRDVLIRMQDTPTQIHLNRQERMNNLKDAFQVINAGSIQGKCLVLVDDVYTTGATTNQCSRILKGAGAAHVYVLSLATGRNM